MKNSVALAPMPLKYTLLVLLGFPVFSTLISLLLLKRDIFSNTGLNFFTIFWLIITLWYSAQIFMMSAILKASGWSWPTIGLTLKKRQTKFLIIGYLIFAFGLLAFIEIALGNANLSPEKLESLSDLADVTPMTTIDRVIFIFMGLVAGLSEEIVYRGFAIRALEKYNISKWLAVVIAGIPFVFQHGLKSIDQFWWFFIWAIVFGIIYVLTRKLLINIIIHWLVILSAMLAVLKVLE